MKIGYARISTPDQKLDYQIDLLNKHGCEKILTDQMTGSLIKRPGLDTLRQVVRSGDQVVIWKFDRLGRSVKDLVEIFNEFKNGGVQLVSLTEGIDTSTPMGQYTFHLCAAMAQMELDTMRERRQAGMALARARGRLGGRPKKLDKDQVEVAHKMYDSRQFSVDQICSSLGISRPTLYKYLRIK